MSDSVFGIPFKYEGKNQNSAPNDFCPFRGSNFLPSLVGIVQKLKEKMQFKNMVTFLFLGHPVIIRGQNSKFRFQHFLPLGGTNFLQSSAGIVRELWE